MTGSDQFVVLVSGQSFILTRSQIEFDSPNYFTEWFSEKPPGAKLELWRNPDLFRWIINHLSGYSMISLDPLKFSLPGSLGVSELRADAAFYGLAKLKSLCEQVLVDGDGDGSDDKKIIVLTGIHYCADGSPGETIPNVHTAYTAMYAEEDKLTASDLQALTTPQSCTGIGGVRELNIVQQIITRALGSGYAKSWKIVGWTKSWASNVRHTMIVLGAQTPSAMWYSTGSKEEIPQKRD
ncbi:hypothetical protein FRC10_010157 [Ceratobasidium sp. 414]|nr:hypothetical protein FRC10_010157 [Ceratobasidium sp. 414]